jgi:MFS family permease
MGTFAAGLLYTNANSAMQRAVRPGHVGRGTGLFMASYYLAAAVSGLAFATLAGRYGWAGAGMLLTLTPIVAFLAMLFVDTSRFNNAKLTRRS